MLRPPKSGTSLPGTAPPKSADNEEGFSGSRGLGLLAPFGPV